MSDEWIVELQIGEGRYYNQNAQQWGRGRGQVASSFHG